MNRLSACRSILIALAFITFHPEMSAQESMIRNAPDRSGEKIHVVGHAHIDMNWLWPWSETKKIIQDNLRQVVAFMDEFDDFTMVQSQAAIYSEIEQTDPALFSRIKKYVAEGRLEPVGGMWTEGDCNLSGGEAIARSFLLGQGYFRSRFNRTVHVGWLPDNFGHPSQLPQILKLAGIDYYYFHRCRPYLGTFWWKGTDGSTVLCFSNFTYNGRVDKDLLNAPGVINPGPNRILAVTGVGDHGGGPTRTDIENVHTFNRIDKLPDIKFTTAGDFFRASEKEMEGRPSHQGEMQFVFEGCYTSNAEIKEGNRRSENSLYQAEYMASQQWLNGSDYPAVELNRCWERLTFNQFHDILPGSGIYETCKDAEADYRDIVRQANDVRDRAFRDFTDGIMFSREKGQPVVAFNMQPCMKDQLVIAEFYSNEKPVSAEPSHWGNYYASEVIRPVDAGQGPSPTIMIRDAEGKEYTGQVTWCKEFPPGYRTRVLFRTDDIPAGGYKTFYVDPCSLAGDNLLMEHDSFHFETDYYIVEFNQQTGDITRLYSKEGQFGYIRPGEEVSLVMHREKPHDMSAWTIGDFDSSEKISRVTDVAVVEQGPVRACIQSTKHWGSSKIVQRIYLYRSYPRVDFDLEIHWFEKGDDRTPAPFLQAEFPLNIEQGEFSCHVPFDVVRRPSDGQEVPAHFFVDVSDGERGIALLNSSKYGHALHHNNLTLSLMRASYDPNLYPNQGMFRVHFALMPHSGDWKQGVWKEGQAFNRPVFAAEPPSLSARSEPASQPEKAALLNIEQGNVAMTGFKQSGDGNELVIRLCEIEGKETLTRIELPVEVTSVRRLNILEDEMPEARKATFTGKRISVDIRPHEIVTLGIGFSRRAPGE
jgi:alpha-mannosidase